MDIQVSLVVAARPAAVPSCVVCVCVLHTGVYISGAATESVCVSVLSLRWRVGERGAGMYSYPVVLDR